MYRYLILVFLICFGGCDRQAPLVIARELANEAQMIDRKAEGADLKVIATLEKALPHFKRHLKSATTDNEAHHETGDLLSRLGAALARQKRTEEAEAAFGEQTSAIEQAFLTHQKKLDRQWHEINKVR